jgi:kinesin family protein 4/21/27
MELKDLKDQLNELVILLKQSEAQRNELVKEIAIGEQAAAITLNTPASVRFYSFYRN